jgi:anti-anti-sigma factor
MEVRVQPDAKESTALLVAVSGKLNTSFVESFWDQVSASHQDGRPSLLLDFSRVTLITSAGVGILIRLHGLASSRGGSLSVFGCQPTVHRAIEVVRLDSILNLVQSLEEARTRIRTP